MGPVPGEHLRSQRDQCQRDESAGIAGQFHGVIVQGARHVALSNITSTNNSQNSNGAWDDLHLDLNSLSSYGESHELTITGVSLGSNSQAVTIRTRPDIEPTGIALWPLYRRLPRRLGR